MGLAVSQSHDPKLDEVVRVLHRIQNLGQQLGLAGAKCPKGMPPSLNQRLAALSPSPNLLGGHDPTLGPFADGTDLQDAKRDQPVGGGPRLE